MSSCLGCLSREREHVQVVEDNSREHEKQKILVDLKSSLEEAFEASQLSS